MKHYRHLGDGLYRDNRTERLRTVPELCERLELLERLAAASLAEWRLTHDPAHYPADHWSTATAAALAVAPEYADARPPGKRRR